MLKSRSYRSRIWELDMLRGIAIVLMVFFHIIFDLHEFFQFPVAYATGPVYYIGKAAAVLFIGVAGISCTLSQNNTRRGIKLLGVGLVITFITSLIIPGSHIVYGILHFLGSAVLLYNIMHKLHPGLLPVLGTAIIGTGFYLQHTGITGNKLLIPLGLPGPDFTSFDYYPLIPWLGVFLYGVAAGKILYKKKASLFPAAPLQHNIINTLGRHSLFIYLVHQPVILSLLFLLFPSHNIFFHK
ncbi:heparan-alpha-glucosaminide N-acetyltransferase [Desulfotomaculum varum]